MQNKDNFFDLYFEYQDGTNESPILYHRWSAIVGLGAWLGRRFKLPFGHQKLHPNIYAILIGLAGTKKSTSVKMFTSLLKSAGYNSFAAEKTSKQQFLIDLQKDTVGAEDIDQILQENIFGNKERFNESTEPSECFIAADEFNEFFENDILKFVATLAVLWDYEGEYRFPLKNSAPVYLWNPTISLLGGNTPTMFNKAFPVDIIGQGFFSRLFLIYAEPTGERITFPSTPDAALRKQLLESLSYMREQCTGNMELTDGAKKLLDKIYKSWPGLDDIRFDSYANRRFTHLLKLCLIHCAARYTRRLDEETVIYANTVLSYAEHFMPKALGEFGKARNSEVVHKIIQLLDANSLPMKLTDIWKHVANDLESTVELSKLIANLVHAEKIMSTQYGFILKKQAVESASAGILDWSMLTKVEQEKII